MGSWDSYTQKSTPEDNDTLMLKDSAAGANKRTPFSGVWNWIVNKMTNAVISNLETTNKMIIPAINELNSKWLSGASENNIDYDNLTAGLHYCGTGCAHAPENYCRVLCMYSNENHTNDSIQVAYPVLSSKIYMRKYGNPGIWTEWKTFSDDASVLKSNFEITTTESYIGDCNGITAPGLFNQVINPDAVNGPGQYAYIVVYSASHFGMITQIAIPYNISGTLKVRTRESGSWRDWRTP